MAMLKCLSHLSNNLYVSLTKGGRTQVRSEFLKMLFNQVSCARAVGEELNTRGRIKYKTGGFKLKTKTGYEKDAEIKEKGAKKVARIEY